MKMSWPLTVVSCVIMMMMLMIMSSTTNVNAQNDPTVAMEGVVQLTSSNFDQYVGTPQSAALVEFYAPWCVHCKNIAEDYALLAKALFNSSSDVGKLIIGKVDATVEKELAAQQKVRGFPTIHFYPAGSNVSEEYSGGRSAEDFVNFLKTKISDLNIVVQRAPESAKDISASALMKMINEGKKDVMIMFYAPWCGFCKQFKPMYEKLAKIYENDQDDLEIVRVNADDSGNRQKLSAFTIHGFPTLVFVPRGDVNATKVFQGDRGMEQLVHFINENAHKFRLLDGDLSWKYGADDDLAKSLASLATMTSAENKDEGKIQNALNQITELANKKKAQDKNIAVQHYLSAAKQIVSEGVSAINKQMHELKVKLNTTKVGKARDVIATQLNVVGSIMASVKKS